ncbi:hypothetical protein Tco_0910574 [Tanacetum coccineum]|uniref:Uncharacterized protein n=1 Tax=Tanacetum coccineum TaxID=301880 RepID=A0ABQ5CZL0_9ASTR
MHTTMVPEQVKTMKIQAGVQGSRPKELRRHLQLWKRFGRLYLIVFVLVRNILIEIKDDDDDDVDDDFNGVNDIMKTPSSRRTLVSDQIQRNDIDDAQS